MKKKPALISLIGVAPITEEDAEGQTFQMSVFDNRSIPTRVDQSRSRDRLPANILAAMDITEIEIWKVNMSEFRLEDNLDQKADHRPSHIGRLALR